MDKPRHIPEQVWAAFDVLFRSYREERNGQVDDGRSLLAGPGPVEERWRERGTSDYRPEIAALKRLMDDEGLGLTWRRLADCDERNVRALLSVLAPMPANYDHELAGKHERARRLSAKIATQASALARSLNDLEKLAEPKGFIKPPEMSDPFLLLIAAGMKMDPEVTAYLPDYPDVKHALTALAAIADTHPVGHWNLPEWANRRQMSGSSGPNKTAIIEYAEDRFSYHTMRARTEDRRIARSPALHRRVHALPELSAADKARLLSTLFEVDIAATNVSKACTENSTPRDI